MGQDDRGMTSQRVETDTVESAVELLLGAIGEDEFREGLNETPKRVAKFFNEWISRDPRPFKLTTFSSEGMDQLIVQRSIPFYSMCEHHLLPFFGEAVVAYIPDKQIIGLSKLARLVDHYSRRPQNQERITKEVAECLHDALKPLGVAVLMSARHMCMEMRGVKSRGAETVTSYLTGVFREDIKAREELMRIAKL